MAITHIATVTAHTYHKTWPTNSRPVLLSASDGNLYVVKGRQNRRVAVNDHLVARLGGLMDAPVTTAALVDLPQMLIHIEPQLTYMPVGISHGSRWIPDCTERLTFEYAHLKENRHRFASLAILYSWAGCWSDHQFIYRKSSPHLVYSVDHGHFFPAGPPWTITSLFGSPSATIDPVFSDCNLSRNDIRKAATTFKVINVVDITTIVNGIPASWGISPDERTAMIDYLARRHSRILTLLS